MKFPDISIRAAGSVAALIVASGLLAGYVHDDATPASSAKPAVEIQEQAGTIDLVKQNWQYMPGVTVVGSALNVSPTDFKIVQQNGSGGQENPPVLLYGTHIETDPKSDFDTTITVTGATADASQQLYNAPPLIADEFRVEPASIRLTETGNDLAIQLYDGVQSGDVTQPVAKVKHYNVAMEHGVTLHITKKAGQLSISANGTVLPDVPSADIFTSGKIWLGLDSSHGNFTVTHFTMRALAGGVLTAVDTTKAPVISAFGGIQDLASKRRPGYLVGAAANLESIVSDPVGAQELFANFGSLTPENIMKMQAIEPQQGNFQFKYLDALVAIAKRQHMTLHGHTLVFSESVPAWVRALPAKQREAVILNYIQTVMTHYKGVFTTVDVINEPLADYDQFDADNHPYRDNVWNEAATSSNKAGYIAEALIAAHKADPIAKIGINEFGLEQSGERRTAMLNLVKQLKAQGVPLDYIGIQAHVYDADTDAIDTTDLNSFIDQLGALSVKARISEMDVTDDAGVAFQSDQFRRVFATCLANKNCLSWTTWGVDDNHDFFQDDDKTLQTGNDLLFNNGKAIAAVNAIKRSIKGK